MSKHTAKDFIRKALEIGALELIEEGRTLKSGRLSHYFFNSGLYTSGRDMLGLCQAYATMLGKANLKFDVIFGPAYKGIPLATGVAMEYRKYAPLMSHIGICFNRKEAKNHGEGGILIGSSLEGKRVLIIDDVITDGASKREAVGIIRAHGGTPVGLAIAFDRKEKCVSTDFSAAQIFSLAENIPVLSIATVDDLISLLSESDKHTGILGKIQDYRTKYGV